MKRDTTEQTLAWYALTQPMVRTANQTATVYLMVVIINMDAIVQEEVIRLNLTRTCMLINKPKIENKSVFICVSSTKEKIFVDLN